MSGNFAWMSSMQYLAQMCHFLGGAFIVFVLGAFFGHEVMWYTLSIGLVIAGLKEFVFDLSSWGEGDSLFDSVLDFAFYVFGGCTGMALFLLAVHQRAAFG